MGPHKCGFRGLRGFRAHCRKRHAGLPALPQPAVVGSAPATQHAAPQQQGAAQQLLQPHQQQQLPQAEYPTTQPLQPSLPGRPSAPHARDWDDVLVADVPALLNAAQRLSLRRVVDRRNHEAWRNCLSLVLRHMADGSDEPRQLAAWRLWALMPRMLLWQPRQPDGRAMLPGKALAARLRRFQRGDWRSLLRESCAAERGPRYTESPMAASVAEAAADARAVQRCLAHYRAGQWGRAAAALFEAARVAEPGAETLRRLRAKFPAPHADAAAALHDIDASMGPFDAVQLSLQSLQSALAGMARKASGGCSRLCADMICDSVLDSAQLLRELLPVAQLVASGTVPAAAVPLLRACRLVALAKPGGSDLRPIGMGDWLRRVASRAVLAQCSSALAAELAPLQLAVGVRGGCESAAKALQARLDSEPHLVLLSFDIKNCFNAVSRARLFRELAARPKLRQLLPLARLLYDGESSMWYSCESSPTDSGGAADGGEADAAAAVVECGGAVEILCREGVQQGCTLGTAFAAVALQPTLEELRRLPGVDCCVAFADDIAVAVQPGNAAAVYATVQRCLEDAGCELASAKCMALCLGGELPAAVRGLGARCVDLGTPVEQRGQLYLGTPLGTDEFRRAWLSGAHLAGMRHCLQRLQLLSSQPQAALTLLRSCVQTKMVYQLRCQPPALAAEVAATYDSEAHAACELIVGKQVAVGTPAAAKLRLPVRDGGAGITALADIASAAYVGSLVDCADLLARIHPSLGAQLGVAAASAAAAALAAAASGSGEGGSGALEGCELGPAVPRGTAPLAALAQHVAAAVADLSAAQRAIVAAAAAPVVAGAEAAGGSRRANADAEAAGGSRRAPLPQTQRALTRSVHQRNAQTFRESIAGHREQEACYASHLGWLGRAWLNAAGCGDTAMSPVDFRARLRDYLFLGDDAWEGVRCDCGRQLGASDAMRHLECCGTVTTRHQTLLGTLMAVYRGAPGGGVPTTTGLGGGRFYRSAPTRYPDALLQRPLAGSRSGAVRRPLVIDISVVSCRTEQALAGGAPRPSGWAARRAAEVKQANAAAWGLDAGLYDFLPVVVETQGAVHAPVVAELRDWAQAAAVEHLGGEAEVSKERLDQQAARILVGWQRLLSVGLAKACVAHARKRADDGRALALQAGPAAVARGALQGAGLYNNLASWGALRQLGLMHVRSEEDGDTHASWE